MELIKINRHLHLHLFLSLKYTDINAVVHAVKTNGGQMKTTPCRRRWILSSDMSYNLTVN